MPGMLYKLFNIGQDRRDWEEQADTYCTDNNIIDTNARNAFKQAYVEMRTVYQYGTSFYETTSEETSWLNIVLPVMGDDPLYQNNHNYNVITDAAKQLLQATDKYPFIDDSKRTFWNNLWITCYDPVDTAVQNMFLEQAERLITPDPNIGGDTPLIIDPLQDPRNPNNPDPYIPPLPDPDDPQGGGGVLGYATPFDPRPTMPDPDRPEPPPEPPKLRYMTTAELNAKWHDHIHYSFWAPLNDEFNSAEWVHFMIGYFEHGADYVYMNVQPDLMGKGEWVAWEEGALGYDHGCPDATFGEMSGFNLNSNSANNNSHNISYKFKDNLQDVA